MRVRVLFFGVLRELAGKAVDEIEMPDGASVRDVIAHYASEIPQFRELLPAVALAVNQQYAGSETLLRAQDEIAFLPPVSGGTAETRCARITRERIDSAQVCDGLKRGEDGAALVFEGVVRNQTRGRRTLYLDYEAYEEMALREMEALAQAAREKFPIRDVAIVHRLGRLGIGETSVLIAVASAHRAAAFEACRWLIDMLKRQVPIWKKEHFEDGAVWADGDPFPDDIRRANS
jgi:molybdopterin synthase catalytic subunit